MTLDEELARMFKILILLLMQKYDPSKDRVEISSDHFDQVLTRFHRPDLFIDRIGDNLVLQMLDESDVAAMCEARDARH